MTWLKKMYNLKINKNKQFFVPYNGLEKSFFFRIIDST